MPPVGGLLSRIGVAILALSVLSAGCVQDAVLENDVRNAVWKARTLRTASDLHLAHAALSSELVELEALYQRNPSDRRVRALLRDGYRLMARGFVEIRRLEALAEADTASAEQAARQRADAEARAEFYGRNADAEAAGDASRALDAALAPPDLACQKHDRATYERQLSELLANVERAPERRLQHALLQRRAALWLSPSVATRCKFDEKL